MVKNEKRLKGSGGYLYFEGSDVKFAQKNFKEKLLQSPELQESFSNEVSQILKEMVYDISYKNTDQSVISTSLFNKMNESLLNDMSAA